MCELKHIVSSGACVCVWVGAHATTIQFVWMMVLTWILLICFEEETNTHTNALNVSNIGNVHIKTCENGKMVTSIFYYVNMRNYWFYNSWPLCFAYDRLRNCKHTRHFVILFLLYFQFITYAMHLLYEKTKHMHIMFVRISDIKKDMSRCMIHIRKPRSKYCRQNF